ncbi:MAG: hypothetical protein RIQ94_1478 [Pseudomonadota bacterium]
MMKDDTNIPEQILENDERVITAKTDGVRLITRKFYAADLVNKVGRFEKKLVIKSHKLPATRGNKDFSFKCIGFS